MGHGHFPPPPPPSPHPHTHTHTHTHTHKPDTQKSPGRIELNLRCSFQGLLLISPGPIDAFQGCKPKTLGTRRCGSSTCVGRASVITVASVNDVTTNVPILTQSWRQKTEMASLGPHTSNDKQYGRHDKT